jgi:hypothetical protein
MSRAEVSLIAAALEEGEQTREVCPFCQGGSSGERSLNVTVRDGVVLYNCHRASCDEQGAIGTSNLVVRTTRKHTRKITPYEGELEHLDDEWVAYLRDTIGWHEGHLDVGRPFFAPEEHRVAFPIFSPMGIRRGWVLRSYEPFARTKTLTRMDVDEPHLSWYRPNHSKHVMVVEDIPSAVRAAQYIDSVALCGSGCSLDYAMEIAAHYRNVVWALDADATAHALRLMRKHSVLFDTSRVLVLEKDIKDEDEERLMEILYE